MGTNEELSNRYMTTLKSYMNTVSECYPKEERAEKVRYFTLGLFSTLLEELGYGELVELSDTNFRKKL